MNNRQKISNILYNSLLVIIYSSYIILALSFIWNPIIVFVPNWESISILMGRIAIMLLWIVSIPGILSRFNVTGVLKDAQIILIKSRRRIGILMFLAGLMHYVWGRVFIYIRLNYIPEKLPLVEIAGITALLLLFPLFLTSNDRSVRFLKQNWKRVHYLIYPAVWLAALHLTLQGKQALIYAIPTFLIGILQATSWVYYKSSKAAN